MNYVEAIILGIVQGITEWLPISSSAHLAIASRILDVTPDLFYFVLLHMVTLLAVIFFLRHSYHSFFFVSGTTKLRANLWYVIIASLPILCTGYFFHDSIEQLFSSMHFIGYAMIVTGIILFSTRFIEGKKSLNSIIAVTTGIIQAFAIIPGISRSGTVSAGASFSGLKKEELPVFVFMVALIPMTAAFVYELIKVDHIMFTLPMLIGSIICFGISLLCIFWFEKILKEGRLYTFWVYCVVVGLILLFN